jgi:hypothetical protein
MDQTQHVAKTELEIKAEPKSPNEILQWIQDLADKLTVKRIFTILLTGILLTFMALVFENRDLVFQQVYATMAGRDQPATWDVSSATKEQLITLVKTSPLVKFAMITEVDLQKNRRIVRFFNLDDPDEANIRLKSATMLPQAVFDYDAKNTQQIVAILNNEFVCSRFQDTVYQRFFPDLGKRMPTICRLAIPPFYGRFVGILTFGLATTPTKEEMDAVRIEAARIAVEIYLRDVIKKPGGQKTPK